MIQKLPLASTSPVLIVGSVAYDSIITPKETREYILGGAATYSALAASYYAPVQLVGVVGNDFDAQHINRFKKHGIDLEGLEIDPANKTFFWKARYHENFNQRETLETDLNAFEYFKPSIPASYADTQYVMLGNIGPDLQLHVLDQLKPNCFVLADTIELWIDIMRPKLLELIKRIHLFVIDKTEAEMLTGETNTILSGHKLRGMGPEIVIIKKGEHGALLFHNEGLFAIPAFPVTKIQDPTGAGDAFAGALMGYLAASKSTSFETLKKGMAYATSTASVAIEAFSSDAFNDTTAATIDQRVRELISMTRF
jgi:sugar/nucleoside kinase (ribokinase family)